MIENKKTLFIADCGIQIAYKKSEEDVFGGIEIQKTKMDNDKIVQELDFFVDKNTIIMLRDFFIKVSNEWI
jgi:hypothetical protein